MTTQPTKLLKEVIGKLLRPNGFKQKENVEGTEPLDCEDKEMSLEKFEQECNDEVCNNEEKINQNVKEEKNPEQSGAIVTLSTSKTSTSKAHISLSNFTNDTYIKRDTEFLDQFQQIMTDSKYIKIVYPLHHTLSTNVSESSAQYQKTN